MKNGLLYKFKSKRTIIIFIIIMFFSGGIFLLYGPISFFRDYLITSSMSTMNHKYIARFLYSDETIDYVLDNNRVIDGDEVSDPDLIDFNQKSASIFSSNEEKQILNHKNSLYKLIKIKGNTYNGYLVAVYNPSKISLATSKNIGESGELITSVIKRKKAIIGINAAGFYDPNWNSNGALAHGIVIKNGKVISDYNKASVGGGFVGFTYDNKLILGRMDKKEAINTGYRDAIEFGPYLIVNGKKVVIKGNGGWGIAPRTAIGQRRDGVVLLLVINGRIPTSIGASMNDLCDIMYKYGAYNAANLDGGSSSELVINNKIINTPVAGGKSGLRKMSTFWIVKR